MIDKFDSRFAVIQFCSSLVIDYRLQIFFGTSKESLLTIKASKVAHHFLTLMNDSAVLLQGEMR